jgi:hypothetical protein
MKTKLYRQGDVLIERIKKLPANLTKVSHENGLVILAHGEVTGHAHSFASAEVEKLMDDDGGEFFRVDGQQIKATLPLIRAWRNQVMVEHPELGLIEFAREDVTVRGDVVEIDGMFGLLKHHEHHAHGVPAGFYRGGSAGDSVRQSEYAPDEIRTVGD